MQRTLALSMNAAASNPSRRLVRPGRVVVFALCGLMAWIAIDVLLPRRTDLRQFDPVASGRLDGEMWRSYYERKPAKLFWQLAQSLRVQSHAGFWNSFPMAYRAAKAAFTFKDGRSRADYDQALPDLEQYFAAVNNLSLTPFNAKSAARNELEWWIIRREPEQFTTTDWERLIAVVAAEIYAVPPERLTEYAHLRVEAMVLRDQRGENITEADWNRIGELLERSWTSLSNAVTQ